MLSSLENLCDLTSSVDTKEDILKIFVKIMKVCGVQCWFGAH